VEFSSGQYLTFRVAREDFAIDASQVRALLPVHELRAAGDACEVNPGWLAGFATLQGRSFPVIDLKSKLGLVPGPHGRHPTIVIVEAATPEGPQFGGFIADRISDVITARESDYRGGKLRIGRPRRVLAADIFLNP
jgi:purine-binding chemotaxis protein CheW